MIQEQPCALSNYVPYLSFCKDSQLLINEQFIRPKVKNFFEVRKISEYEHIEISQYISDLDYKTKTANVQYFYKNILVDIKKSPSSGKVQSVIKYSITLDEQVTSKVCEKTKIKYDEILLNTTPIFYFIYVDLKEILDFVRKSK